ncbi:calcium uniporter protein 6, mitochondrial-like [Telopea speciosissima]|uniref:calcium uniporter protein 6, mitochondrial-like n=1 Tax=Telopea speciosissima TaxID=54955 RepID=UPI001CC6B6BA|nr:calcium uniporter protein 6, mitochondrial-like [Telopea speciosissima]
MWRSSGTLLKRSLFLTSAARKPLGLRWAETESCGRSSRSSPSSGEASSKETDSDDSCHGKGGSVSIGADDLSFSEVKKLLRLVNVDELKRKLGMRGKEVISYSELLQACESMDVVRSPGEAAAFARVLDEAGVVLLFRNMVYLEPDKVVDQVRRAVSLVFTPEGDLRRDELKRLQKEKEEIDMLAHKHVRRILWSGLGFGVVQVGLFFRLTFWEFSWDVMEPIAFFSTTAGLLIGYTYFMFTSRDPTYQDMMERLFLSRRKKMFKKYNFDVDRYLELERQCKSPLHITTSAKGRVELETGDSLHKD